MLDISTVVPSENISSDLTINGYTRFVFDNGEDKNKPDGVIIQSALTKKIADQQKSEYLKKKGLNKNMSIWVEKQLSKFANDVELLYRNLSGEVELSLASVKSLSLLFLKIPLSFIKMSLIFPVQQIQNIIRNF